MWFPSLPEFPSLSNKPFLAFIIGSSILSCIVTFSYLGFYHRNRRTDNSSHLISYEQIPIIVPILFGIANVVLYLLNNSLEWKYRRVMAVMIGSLTGFVFSLIGRFGYDLPDKLFKIEKNKQSIVHAVAPLLYSVIFGLIVQSLNDAFLM